MRTWVRKAVVLKYNDTEGLAPGKSDVLQIGKVKRGKSQVARFVVDVINLLYVQVELFVKRNSNSRLVLFDETTFILRTNKSTRRRIANKGPVRIEH